MSTTSDSNTNTVDKPKSKPIDINKPEGKMNTKTDLLKDFGLGYQLVAENSFKLVLGSSWSNTIGAYTNMKLASSVGLTIGVKFDTTIASKNSVDLIANSYTFSRTHVQFEDKETSFKRQALFGEKEEVVADETTATLSQVTAIADSLAMINNRIDTNVTSISNTTTQLGTTVNRIEETLTDVQTRTTVIDDVVARVDTAEAKITKAGTYLANHEASIATGGLNIVDAGITMLG
ncbi:hypothetical protein [uncultured Shewanella sp.]|uniref:hypothetical protein n=1 Tax=uncultured Shewanella sp. TaxID=173975 RepID=UPI0026189595|nr:hypothetical protein [uncultured Shewanella sp.]